MHSATTPAEVRALAESGADPNFLDTRNGTPLMRALERGRYAVAETLISVGARVDARTPTGYTALQHACNLGDRTAAELLLEHGADPNLRDNLGFAPIHYSCRNGNAAIVTLLMSYGADPNPVSKKGYSAKTMGMSHPEVAAVYEMRARL